MKYIPFFAMALLLIMTGGGCGAQYITQEQAKEAVRAFEGNPNLQFSEVEFGERNDGPEWNHEAWYFLSSESPSEDVGYRVDASTGEITTAGYSHRELSDPVDDPPGPLTQEDCRQIAEGYARAKYSGFDAMNFHLGEQTWNFTGWEFVWEQTLDYGAVSSNYVLVDVNPVDGLIEFYRSNRVPVTPIRAPQVTSEQATEIARQATEIITITSAAPLTLFGKPDGGSRWRVEIAGLNAEGDYPAYVVLVDAETGALIGDIEPSGGSAGPPMPAPSIVGGPPISLRELAAKVPGAKVHWLGKEGARLFVGKDRYTLVPGKDTIEWTGGTIKLSQKMTLMNGRLMVPSGLLDALKSAPAPKKAPPASAKSK